MMRVGRKSAALAGFKVHAISNWRLAISLGLLAFGFWLLARVIYRRACGFRFSDLPMNRSPDPPISMVLKHTLASFFQHAQRDPKALIRFLRSRYRLKQQVH